MGEEKRGETNDSSVRSIHDGSQLTDWKQAETFTAAVSRAAINPLSGLFIAQPEREFLICVKIAPRDRRLNSAKSAIGLTFFY